MRNEALAQHVKGKIRVVIVGAGFGGLYAAKSLARNASLSVTLVDKRNYHLFQPLLYQVATGMLSPGDIASPIRHILRYHKNVRVIQASVTDIAPDERKVFWAGGELEYDILIAACGVKHSYFGNDHWRDVAPGLKTVEHALEMRQRIFSAFEAAEVSADPAERRKGMCFLVVGAGPTGVELAGAVGELAHRTLPEEFRHIDTRNARVILAEGADQILPSYPEDLSRAALRALKELGVEVRTGTLVTEIEHGRARLEGPDGAEEIAAGTVLWAAGVQTSRFGQTLAERTGSKRDRAGKIHVNLDLSLPSHPEIFVIGDLAHLEDGKAGALPGVAQVALQQGRYMARVLAARQRGVDCAPFRYKNKGSMAVIGRNRAIADLGWLHLRGTPAWYLWAVVHIMALVGFGNRLLVMTRWAWSYVTRQSGVRLITSIPQARTEQTERAHHPNSRPSRESQAGPRDRDTD